MIKKLHSLTMISTLVAGFFACSAVAADKVVVIPLGGKNTAIVGDAVAADVLDGKTFSGESGVGIPGTMPDNGAVLIHPSDSDQSIPSGYHNGSGSVVGDAALTPDNIKDGVSLFDQTGTFTSESTNPMTAADLRNSKVGFVNGVKITGTMPTGDIYPFSSTVPAAYYEETDLQSEDYDLSPYNIKAGVEIFGIRGTYDCPEKFDKCSDTCVDTDYDPGNCGACGEVCEPGSYCAAGSCLKFDGSACTFNGDCVSRFCDNGECQEGGKVAFITGDFSNANLGGLTGADNHCNYLARGAGLAGDFKAWLSDGTVEGSPAARFDRTTDDVPYHNASGSDIAPNWAGLTDGTLDRRLTTDQHGQSVVTYRDVWSNVWFDGTALKTETGHCLGWTSDSDALETYIGYAAATSPAGAWTATDEKESCALENRYYCFEQ